MFSVSDIKETVYPAAYRRGKELYETAGVFDFSYELYLVDELPVADVRAKVRGIKSIMKCQPLSTRSSET